MVEVAHRIRGLVGRQVLGVGDPPAGGLAGMDLDQYAAVIDPDQMRVGPHLALCCTPIRLSWIEYNA